MWMVNTRVVTLLAEILRMASDPQKQSRQAEHLQHQHQPRASASSSHQVPGGPPHPISGAGAGEARGVGPEATPVAGGVLPSVPQQRPARPQQRLVQAVYGIAAAGGLLMRATDGMAVDGEACTMPQLEVWPTQTSPDSPPPLSLSGPCAWAFVSCRCYLPSDSSSPEIATTSPGVGFYSLPLSSLGLFSRHCHAFPEDKTGPSMGN